VIDSEGEGKTMLNQRELYSRSTGHHFKWLFYSTALQWETQI